MASSTYRPSKATTHRHVRGPIHALVLALVFTACAKQSAPESRAGTPSQASLPPTLRALANTDEIVPACEQAKVATRACVVYVGASWCEPCLTFHKALAAGELDTQLRGIDFLEFDWDQSQRQLDEWGYAGNLIPRFVLPQPDGHASTNRVEGGIKGEGVLGYLVPRIQALVAQRETTGF